MDHLLPATVNDQIFPHIAQGFTDTVPALRELTVKVRGERGEGWEQAIVSEDTSIAR